MDRTPVIPDFELLRLIGRGSYGDVWLARGITGGFRAIKVVWRDQFEREKTFEREFEGIRRFEPVSRHNRGLVDVLHVGRNAKDKFYYYVMELADDAAEDAGEEVNPVEYAPRTLAADMTAKNPAVLQVFLDHGKTLCDALQHLHEKGLAHRDVKPSNIIFVDGVPKLADIGLVAATGQRTYVGTEGYIPPEGPGSEAADIYSLGMVLYETMTGNDRLDFPELPPEKNPIVGAATWRELNEIVCRACAPTPNKRYPSAQAFGAALEGLGAVKRTGPARKIVAGAAIALVGIGIAFAFQWKGAGPVDAPDPPPVAGTGDNAANQGGTDTTPPAHSGTNALAASGGTTNGAGDPPAVATTTPPDPDLDPGDAPGTPEPDPDPALQPRESEPWTNSVGMKFLPESTLHVSGQPTEKLVFDRFIDEDNRALVGEVITIGGSDGGAYRHIIAVPLEDAVAFTEWIREKDLEEQLITGDHYYRIRPFDQFTSRNESGEVVQLAFYCVLEKQAYGALEITTNPPGATVLDGDEIVGTTPFHATRLAAGPVRYRLHLQGYEKVTLDEELPPGGTLSRHFDLEESGALVMGRPWENSLKMKFAPLNGIMVSIWETRKMDFDVFVLDTGRESHHVSDIGQEGDHPVVLVNRQDAVEFCEWLSDRERRAGLLEPDQEYRLPTDLEWSQAAGLPRERGKDPASRNQLIKGIYPWGYICPPDEAAGNFADRSAARALPGEVFSSYDDGQVFTSPAGSYPPNAFGLFDLGGNVWEWIAEPFGGTVGRFQELGVVRGGSWSTSEKNKLLSSCRNAIPADLRDPIYGFRCVIGVVSP